LVTVAAPRAWSGRPCRAAAAISLVAKFFYIPVYPLWALTIMVIDMLVIWALTAQGCEMRNA
jgi:hypothetical protein